MASSNACWGIEIGAGAIKALKLEVDGDQWTVSDYAIVNHPKVLSTPDLDQEDALRVSLGTLVSQKDLSGAGIAISVPGHQSFARFAKLPPVEPKKVPDIVKFEAVQQIPFPLEDVEWDYQTFVSPESPEVEVGIFAITRPRIMEKLQLLGDVGLTPDIATLSPIAAYNALAADLEFTEDTPGTIIIDIGTTATDIIIADAGRVWMRTFPIGGHQFTDALVTSFKLSYPKAERLKREAEQTKHARHVFQAMRPVFTDLVQEIQRSIGFYQSVHEGADLQRIIGLGSTFQLPGLKRYLKQQLSLNTYRIEEFKKLRVDPSAEQDFNAQATTLGTAYGLALQGLELGTLNANLIPVSEVRTAMWKRKRPWFGVAAGLAAAAGAAMFIRPVLDQSAVTSAERPRSIDLAVREAGNLAREANDLGVTGGDGGDTTADRIASLFDGRDVFAHIAADLSDLFAEATAAARVEELIEPGQVAFEIVSLSASFAPAQQQDRNRRPARFDPESGRPVEEAAGPESFDRIDVAIRADSPMVEAAARALAGRVVERWLDDNAERDGVPYRVVAAGDLDLPSRNADPRRARPRAGSVGAPTRRSNIPRAGSVPAGATVGRMGGVGGPVGGTAPADPGVRTDEELISAMERIAPIEPPEGGSSGGSQPGTSGDLPFTLSFVFDPAMGGDS